MSSKTPDDSGILMLVIYVCIGALVVYLAMHMSGCGLFSSGVPEAVQTMALKAAERVAKEVGKELSEVPMQCEFELDQKSRKLLMLCEADLSDMR